MLVGKHVQNVRRFAPLRERVPRMRLSIAFNITNQDNPADPATSVCKGSRAHSNCDTVAVQPHSHYRNSGRTAARRLPEPWANTARQLPEPWANIIRHRGSRADTRPEHPLPDTHKSIGPRSRAMPARQDGCAESLAAGHVQLGARVAAALPRSRHTALLAPPGLWVLSACYVYVCA